MGNNVESFAMIKDVASGVRAIYDLACAEAKRWAAFREAILGYYPAELGVQRDANPLPAGQGLAVNVAFQILGPNPRRKGFLLHIVGAGTDIVRVKLGSQQPSSATDGSLRVFGGTNLASGQGCPVLRWTGAVWGQWDVNATPTVNAVLITEWD